MPPLIRFMVGDNKTTTKQFSVEIEATLPPAGAELGAGAKADQQLVVWILYNTSCIFKCLIVCLQPYKKFLCIDIYY